MSRWSGITEQVFFNIAQQIENVDISTTATMIKPYDPYRSAPVKLGLDRDLSDEEWQALWKRRLDCILLSKKEEKEEENMRKEFEKAGLLPLEIQEIPDCIRRALRRFSILINPLTDEDKKQTLRMNDNDLENRSKESEDDHKLFAFDFLSTDPSRSDHEEKTRCFYNALRLIKHSNIEKVDFELTTPFLVFLHIGQRPLEQDLLDGLNESQKSNMLRHSVTAYVVKNLLHNFVHIRAQGINEHNYHDFQGRLREDSDFEADIYANLLLLKAYGLRPISNGQISRVTQHRIDQLFKLADGNRIFYLRSKFRPHEDERRWRRCRTISNKVSQSLIKIGRSPSAIKVYIDDKDIVPTPLREPLRFNQISATINNRPFRAFRTKELFSPIEQQKKLTPEEKDNDKKRREQLISQHFVSSVQEVIDNDSTYSEYFSTSLETEMSKFKVPD